MACGANGWHIDESLSDAKAALWLSVHDQRFERCGVLRAIVRLLGGRELRAYDRGAGHLTVGNTDHPRSTAIR